MLHTFYKSLRVVYRIVFNPKPTFLDCEENPECINNIIKDTILSEAPCMICRFGSVELSAVTNYLSIKDERRGRLWRYISGKSLPWWWDSNVKFSMKNNAGFFPNKDTYLERFAQLILHDIPSIDVLGCWNEYESKIEGMLKGKHLIRLRYLEPFWVDNPWTSTLKGKKVLIIHPYKDTILAQYEKRNLIFNNKEIIPDCDLKVLRSVQSIGGNTRYKDWFEALESMEKEIDSIDYDIALLGCGAYGFPLAAHIKNRGKKAIHIGGALQLFFGIKGKRWDSSGLYNQHWTRPFPSDTTPSLNSVEGGCYL